ncbi:hypothetical protein D3C84_1300110 [compost metagenome]
MTMLSTEFLVVMLMLLRAGWVRFTVVGRLSSDHVALTAMRSMVPLVCAPQLFFMQFQVIGRARIR